MELTLKEKRWIENFREETKTWTIVHGPKNYFAGIFMLTSLLETCTERICVVKSYR